MRLGKPESSVKAQKTKRGSSRKKKLEEEVAMVGVAGNLPHKRPEVARVFVFFADPVPVDV